MKQNRLSEIVRSNLKLSLIDAYLIQELLPFFLFSVGLFTSLGVTIGTVSDLVYKITEYRLPSIIALQIFIYKIPEYAAYALPISLLLTTLIVYGRFSNNSEAIACQSVGIAIYRLIIPAIIVSSIVTGMAFMLNEFIVPIANYRANLLQEPFLPETQLKLQSKDIFYPEYEIFFEKKKGSSYRNLRRLKKIYYAEQFDGTNFLNITIISWSENKLKQIIIAKSAHWDRHQNAWQLIDGKINNLAIETSEIDGAHKPRPSRAGSAPYNKKFTNIYLKLSSTVFEIASQERSPYEMSLSQAQKYLVMIRDTGKETEIRSFQVRIQQKLAFPFICTIFALVGSALGINADKVDRSRGFGLCVAIAFLYYLLAFVTGALGIAGIFAPIIAAWLPNLLGLAIGAWLTVSSNRS